MELLPKPTRFRAYQIGTAGSLFSYYNGSSFTLIDANITDQAEESLVLELGACGKKKIDKLHVTSWDADHCSLNGINKIVKYLQPSRIELPGYDPESETGKDCKKLITKYMIVKKLAGIQIVISQISPEYINSLDVASSFNYDDVIYHPSNNFEKHNDNSTIKLFRTGSFTVASLGDVESPEIATRLLNCKIFTKEVDVMILAHHGADNGFTTKDFIAKTKPTVAVCSSDYANKYDHPKQEIRDLLDEENVKLFTTKTGDVIIESYDGHKDKFLVTNLKSNSSDVSSQYEFITKRGNAKIIHDVVKNLLGE